MNYYEILSTLMGKIQPVADEHIDIERFDNLAKYHSVIESLIYEIYSVAQNNKTNFDSVIRSSKQATSILRDIKNDLENYLSVLESSM